MDDFPSAVLLVDRLAIVVLFATFESVARARIAVVCINGTPSGIVAALVQSFEAGRRVPVFYLHDAATIVYPFEIEPLAALVRHRGDASLVYRDLGLPPLGASARRFGDPSLPSDEPIFELEAIPPATIVRYVLNALTADRQTAKSR